ncbi:hypothetical protein jhhlp_003214 [Lomentospora prolificans]|uniref:Uncharacterized protein n=1 Tax=Lomentospora prolificans TaxID=41688 RepID=A0A2N3NG79_9PEZI|nr:hypothetical protein jhhlp_003214 [Lomentospora prolificans]
MIDGHHIPFKLNQASTSSSDSISVIASSSSNLASSFTTSSTRAWSLRRSRSLLASLVAPSLLLCHVVTALPSTLQHRQAADNTISAAAVADDAAPSTTPTVSTYLPAQIGGIVGSYAISLVIVAIALLVLSKRRREHLSAGENEVEFLQQVDKPQATVVVQEQLIQERQPTYAWPPTSPRSIPRSPVVLNTDVGYASIDSTQAYNPYAQGHIAQNPYAQDRSPYTQENHSYVLPTSPTSTIRSPLGIDTAVDQSVVAADREMAQTQLEDMYKYVMEHEEAKLNGVEAPPVPITAGAGLANPRVSNSSSGSGTAATIKKERARPAQLNLSQPVPDEKRQSKASALFSALRSPKKNKMKGMTISSPIMTPMSGTFPRESQELNTIPPRQYAPAAPPPVPTDQSGFAGPRNIMPLTPDLSPDGTQSIDERLGALPMENRTHARNVSFAPSENEPVSAVSTHSQSPLVGLPQSPKPGVNRFPTLPASPRSFKGPMTLPSPQTPKPGSSFSRANAPSAVRTGGALPLRAYENPLASPTTNTQTKQTVFERMGPLSPGGGRTPFTATAVPYSPYQPFSPCIPMTPSLVTKADRKRMRKLEPKTPTVEMVKSTEDLW